jgi:hypothetical protein
MKGRKKLKFLKLKNLEKQTIWTFGVLETKKFRNDRGTRNYHVLKTFENFKISNFETYKCVENFNILIVKCSEALKYLEQN